MVNDNKVLSFLLPLFYFYIVNLRAKYVINKYSHAKYVINKYSHVYILFLAT